MNKAVRGDSIYILLPKKDHEREKLLWWSWLFPCSSSAVTHTQQPMPTLWLQWWQSFVCHQFITPKQWRRNKSLLEVAWHLLGNGRRQSAAPAFKTEDVRGCDLHHPGILSVKWIWLAHKKWKNSKKCWGLPCCWPIPLATSSYSWPIPGAICAGFSCSKIPRRFALICSQILR